MNNGDRKDFYELMTKSFGDYGKTAPVEMMEEWFEDLIDYSFFQIRGAFRAYKLENIYAPVIASIRKYALRISRQDSKTILRCSNNFGNKICGAEIFVHGLCEICYDNKRPKSFVDLKQEENLKHFYERGKSLGCVTKKEFSDLAKDSLRIIPLGQKVLKNIQYGPSDDRGSVSFCEG